MSTEKQRDKETIARLRLELEAAIDRAGKAEAETTEQKLVTKEAIAANHDAFELAKDQAARLAMELLEASKQLADTREELQLSRDRATRLESQLTLGNALALTSQQRVQDLESEVCFHGIKRAFCTGAHDQRAFLNSLQREAIGVVPRKTETVETVESLQQTTAAAG